MSHKTCIATLNNDWKGFGRVTFVKGLAIRMNTAFNNVVTVLEDIRDDLCNHVNSERNGIR